MTCAAKISWPWFKQPASNTVLSKNWRISATRAKGLHVPACPPRTRLMPQVGVRVALQVVVTALLVGFLTGFLGVGGGFIVVPALVLILGYSMPVAAATSLLVIALNAGVSLAIHAGSFPQFDWAIIVPFTAATIIASLIGKRLASRVSGSTLTVAFAVVLLLVAAGIGIQVAAPHLGLT